jgi:tryptophanyl-tRNA synthetase
MKKDIVLTGDRPTGPLHLGHYIGSLINRVQLQNEYEQYVMIADIQALTDNYAEPHKIRNNVQNVLLDYLSVGIDPQKSTIFIQSLVPEIAELTIFYLNLVTVSRLERNPTVKTEIMQKDFGKSLPVGFLAYPISQAADITSVKGTLIPVGEDQIPVIEQTNEIVRTFNRIYDCQVLKEAKPLLTKVSRLPGIDGKAKMSKSLGNAIFLSDSTDEVAKKVMKMFTDPNHLRVQDPGKIEGNTVFTYLDSFAKKPAEIIKLKEAYQRGGMGDVTIKKYLIDVLEELLTPIRKKRNELQQDPEELMKIALEGTAKVREVAAKTLREVKEVMCLDY